MGLFDAIKAQAKQFALQRMTEEVTDFFNSAVGGQKNLDVLIGAGMTFYEAVPVIFRSREGAAWLKRKKIIIDVSVEADIREQLIEKIRKSSFSSYLKSMDIESSIAGFGVIIKEAGFKVPEWYLRVCLEEFSKALRS